MSSVHVISTISRELRHAVRALANAKATAAVLLLSLALGTGVNAAVYGVLSSLLFGGPAGVESLDGLVNVHTSEYSGTAFGQSSYPDFLSMRERSNFAALAAIDDASTENVRVGDTEAVARIAAVSAEFFSALEMSAEAGELTVAPVDGMHGAVISADLARQLGGNAVIGRALGIAERTYVIRGIAPEHFRGLRVGRECDVWIALSAPSAARGDRRYAIVGRLANGREVDGVQRDVARLSEALASRYPDSNRGTVIDPSAPRRFTVLPFSRLDPAASDQTMLIAIVIGGASTLLLAAACCNVGGLLLSWAFARRIELAVKMAIGATRSALVRQLLLETLCVSLAGGALGALFAAWTIRAIPALFMTEQASLIDTHLSLPTMLLTVAIACAAGALFGIAPALHATSTSPATALRADAGALGQSHGGNRLRVILVGAQVTLSTLLLLGTGLLAASLDRALEGDLAATVKRIAIVAVELPGRFHDEPRGTAHRTLLLDRVLQAPGVALVAWSSSVPLQRARTSSFRLTGTNAAVTNTQEFDFNVVTPEYFDVLSLRRLEGRLFDATDRALSEPVIVVDELLARHYFGSHAVGQSLIDVKGDSWKIIGVVQSGRYRTLQQSPQPTVYFPAAQKYLYLGYVLARTAGDPAPRIVRIRDVAEAVGSGATIFSATTLERRLAESLTLDRLTTTLVGGCGLIALVMSTLGVYGIMMDAVHRRTREIGLRLALGAGPRRIASLIFLEAAYPAIAGLAIGVVAALVLARAAQYFFYGVPPADWNALAAAAAILALVIAIAAVVPLRRALRVHPNIALRAE